MSVVFIDGFDHRHNVTIGAKITGGQNISCTNAKSRAGIGQGASTVFGAFTRFFFGAGDTRTMVTGFAWKDVGIVGTGPIATISGLHGTQPGLEIGRWVDGSLYVARGNNGGVLRSGVANQVLPATWYYIELKAKLSTVSGSTQNADGEFNLRLNGVTLFGNVTGQITRNSSTDFSTYDAVALGRAGNFEYYFDDWYILNEVADNLTDPLGGPTINNNDFLGDVRVGTIYPNGASLLGAGHTDLTPTGVGTNWQNVDEDPVPGAITAPNVTDFNAHATPENSDTYKYQALSLPTGSKIFAVQLVPHMQKSVAGLKYASCLCDSGGNQHQQTQAIIPDTGAYLPYVMKSAPTTANGLKTSGWTKAEVDGAEFGIRVKA